MGPHPSILERQSIMAKSISLIDMDPHKKATYSRS